MAAYPIASLANGMVLMSDGTKTYPMSSDTNSSAQNYNPTYAQNYSTQDLGSYSQEAFQNNFNSLLSSSNKQTDDYIDQLLADAGGDKDFVISQLVNAHTKAVGNNDAQTAAFLETVADKLEERIGRIPYDYQVGVTRINEQADTGVSRTQRDQSSALKRLAEDEQVWKQEFDVSSKDSKTAQQEELLRRGIIQGTRDDASGLAGGEVKKLDTELANTLGAYNRSLGRTREDINTGASDTIYDINKNREYNLADTTTAARRGVIDANDTFSFGKTAAERKFEAIKAQLERERLAQKQNNAGQAAYQTSIQYG